ncbi:MAG: FMN-binding protein [Chromatiales bacterium]|nr:FMN-binding protein [Chromatiales bacterium]
MTELQSIASPAQPEAPPEVSSTRMIMTMAGIGIISGILLVFTYMGTLPTIEKNKAEALERAIFDVVPGATSKLTFTPEDGRLRLVDPSEKPTENYYAAYDDEGKLVGIAVEAAGQGFADIIKVLYGYDPVCQCIIGFKVLATKETPGLGDKIETDPAFVANFEALDVSLSADGSTLANPVVFAKPGQKTNPWEVEGITGATITSKAIQNLINVSAMHAMAILQNNIQVLRDGNTSSQHTNQD